jgi:hypothetical protein
MYRLTALVFLLAAVFSHASADDIVERSVPTHPVAVPARGPFLSRVRRAEGNYCNPEFQKCGNGHCCPPG